MSAFYLPALNAKQFDQLAVALQKRFRFLTTVSYNVANKTLSYVPTQFNRDLYLNESSEALPNNFKRYTSRDAIASDAVSDFVNGFYSALTQD